MKKQRTQPAFASLTQSEIEQIADSLDGATYDAVLTRICQPRSAGGFGLNISKSPLERLWARHAKLKKINAHIASGEKLTLAKLDAIEAAETPASQEAHDAIMRATCDLATSGDNTPAQLLALQRLADFPERAAHRDQMADLRAERADLARAKEQRAIEMHTHKITLTLRQETHKIEMDTFRKHIATERLELTKLRLKQVGAACPSGPSLKQVGPVCPSGPSRDPNNETGATTADLGLNPNPVHPHNPVQNPSDDSAAPAASETPIFASPCPLPPEVIAENRRYAEKLRTGKIIFDRSGPYIRDIELPDDPSAVLSTSEPATTNP